MTNSPLSQLKRVAKSLTEGHAQSETPSSLDQTVELEDKGDYESLKNQFHTVNLQLQESNAQITQKLEEFHLISTYLNNIISHISQGLIFIDFNGIITTFNLAASQMLEVDNETVLFESFWTQFPDNIFGYSMRETLTSRKPPPLSYASVTLKSGATKEFEIGTSLVLEDDAPASPISELLQGFVVLIRDVTDYRRLQMIANRNDRLKELGEMAAMVAHEIRNPLGGIKGFASLLQRDLEHSPELQKMAGFIVEGTDNLNRLVSKVLNYARPVLMKLEQQNLVPLMEDLVKHVKADNSLHVGITVELKCDESEIIIPTDASVLKGAILNIVVNSIQAMPEGGTLTITLSQTPTHAKLIVADTGVGIPEENIEKIFSPFFTTRPDGNGFGLAEVYKVVQAHDGTIEVKSALGKGTTFTISLPLRTSSN